MDGVPGEAHASTSEARIGGSTATVDWLLDGDPSIRWQVLADLVGAPHDKVETERARVAAQGWGARLLAEQSADGRWAQALYSPKWTSTTYSLLASSFGLHDDQLDPTVRWLLDQQLADGGWNCESIRSGSRHGSFNTSISALDALLEYQQSGGGLAVSDSMDRGRRFFLDHRLYRAHRTGELVNPAFTRFPFPPQWHFDVLRGLEHFRAAGAAADPPLGEAVEVVRRARRADGTWPVHRAYPGRTWFRMESPGPSRWATLRAMRVLQWWDQDAMSTVR
jgi:hypothetical protein